MTENTDNTALLEQIKTLSAELDKVQHFNSSLLRMCRERANADRDLRPKKQHSGYLLKSSVQIKIRRTSPISAAENIFNKKPSFAANNSYAWKSTFETPYDNHIPFDLVMELMMSDLDAVLMPQLHVKYRQPNSQNGTFRSWEESSDGHPKEICGIYGWSFSCNQRYWQITLYHTLPLNLQEDAQ